MDFLLESKPEVLCLQETKAAADDLAKEAKEILDYSSYFSTSLKKGYSGVALYLKEAPSKIYNLDYEAFDNEGRGIVAEYPNFCIVNCYFPNSQDGGKRLSYKIEFLNYIKEYCKSIENKGNNVILCGDFNIAPNPIDLEYPKENEGSPGYLPEERGWFKEFIESGFIDVFRHFYPNAEKAYTWWSYRTRARERNIGWRIDHFCVNKSFLQNVESIKIRSDVYGSDHCPIELNLN